MSFSIKNHPVGSKVFICIGTGLCWVGEVESAVGNELRLVKASCVTELIGDFKNFSYLPETVTGALFDAVNTGPHSPLCIANVHDISTCRTYNGELPFTALGIKVGLSDTNCAIRFQDEDRWVAVTEHASYLVNELHMAKDNTLTPDLHVCSDVPAFIAHILANIKKP